MMETLKVDILNPRARKLIRNLADQNLIAIRDNKSDSLQQLLNSLHSQTTLPPNLDEITKEVETVRTQRYKSK